MHRNEKRERRGGRGDGQREKERGGEEKERETRKRRKGKGEDERGKEKGEVSHDVLEADTSSSWAHPAPEHSRIENTKCMNWRESNGDHCKEVEMVRSVQCAMKQSIYIYPINKHPMTIDIYFDCNNHIVYKYPSKIGTAQLNWSS